MKRLNKIIRNIISRQDAELIYQTFNSPEYKSFLEKSKRNAIDTYRAMAYDSRLQEFDGILKNIGIIIGDVRYLKNTINEYFRKEVLISSKRFAKEKKNKFIRQVVTGADLLRVETSNSEFVGRKELDPIYNGLVESYRKKDIVIAELAKIAEKAGLEQASSKNVRSTLIREIFPSQWEYREFRMFEIEGLTSHLTSVSNYSSLSNSDEDVAREIVLRIQRDWLREVIPFLVEKEIKEIYDESPNV